MSVGQFSLQAKQKKLSSVMHKSAVFITQFYHPTCSILGDKIDLLFGYWSTDFAYVSMVTACSER